MTKNKNDNLVDPMLLNRATINPYRSGIYQIFDRLKWDVHPAAWRSRSRLKRYKDTQVGRKAVIVCNGPSLLKSDLSLLRDTYTFGLNKINLLFDRDPFRPGSIVAVNRLVIEQNQEFYNKTELPLFLDTYAHSLIRERANIAYLHSGGSARLARDCSVSINQGYTVTTVALQIAFHMGFQSVAVIGCDHNFATKGPANKTVIAGEKDDSHFDPRYFSGGVKWQLPDLVASEFYYTQAREMYEAFGRTIYNCTEGGALEVFPRLGLREFLSS